MLKESAMYNYQTGRERRSRLRSEEEDEKMTYRERFRKAETERSEEKQRENQADLRKKQELGIVYQREMDMHSSRKTL
jgi:hypothetical protein